MTKNQFLLLCELYRKHLIGGVYTILDENNKTLEKTKITNRDILLYNNFRNINYVQFDLKCSLVMTYDNGKTYCVFNEKKENWSFEKLYTFLGIKTKLEDII